MPVVIVLDEAERTDAATCLLIRMLLATSGLRVMILAAGNAGVLAEQSSRPGGESLCVGKLAGDPPRRQEYKA